MKHNKTRKKKSPNSEPKVTWHKLHMWKLIHLPAHRHTHLACLYLYAWTRALCSVEAFWVFLNQWKIKNHCAYRREDGKIPLSLSSNHPGYRTLETAALLATSSKTESQNRYKIFSEILSLNRPLLTPAERLYFGLESDPVDNMRSLCVGMEIWEAFWSCERCQCLTKYRQRAVLLPLPYGAGN